MSNKIMPWIDMLLRGGEVIQFWTRYNVGGQVMTNIVKFPGGEALRALPVSAPVKPTKGASLLTGAVRLVWVVVVLVWPVCKWIISIEVFFQFVYMMYHWNTPSVYAGWTFLLHFAVLAALTYFVAIYKPQGM